MIYWIVANSYEAKPIITKYQMKRRSLSCRFEVYETDNQALIISGQGGRLSSVATAYLLGLYPQTNSDLCINIGICGTNSNSLLIQENAFLCVSLERYEKEDEKARKIYPQWDPSLKLRGASLFTSIKPVTNTKISEPALFDMEGYDCLYTAGMFLSPEKLVCIKVVSDTLSDAFCLTKEKITILLENCLEKIAPWIDEKLLMMQNDNKNEIAINKIKKDLNELTKSSLSMERQIDHLVTYVATLFDEDPLKTEEYFRGHITFCKDRKEGKAWVANEITRLQSEFPKETLPTSTSNVTKKNGWLIYVEKKVYADLKMKEAVQNICNKKMNELVFIDDYQDLFQRSKQSFLFQKQHQAMIFAKKEGELVYKGAPMCHDYGYENFCYTSCVMNCVYDCEYCYLQGMYSCGHLVIFTNLDDIMKAAIIKADGKPMYLAVSFDTDLLALEGLLHYGKRWLRFARENENIHVELRTKSSGMAFLNEEGICDSLPPKNFILSWSLSPDIVTKTIEHHTAGLKERLKGIKRAMELGFFVRLCFDPLLFIPNWEKQYEQLIKETFLELPQKPFDISIGVFRLGKEYLSKMRKQRENSFVLQYPYEQQSEHVQYPKALSDVMLKTIKNELLKYMPEDKIYIWDDYRKENDGHS